MGGDGDEVSEFRCWNSTGRGTAERPAQPATRDALGALLASSGFAALRAGGRAARALFFPFRLLFSLKFQFSFPPALSGACVCAPPPACLAGPAISTFSYQR